MQRDLTDADYRRGAYALGVDIPTIKAVAEVESRGEGFLPSNEPKILYERHIFRRLTGGRYDAKHPDLSGPPREPGEYGPPSIQHQRLQRAADLDRDAALQSASWGAFQVMGFNWRACGYLSLQAFINAMYRGAGGQLDAMLGLVRSSPQMLRALRERRWATFARLYNGPNYRMNRYDEKLAAAYERHST